MYCNERVETNCPICGADIKVAFTINEEAKPDGGTHTSAGDYFTVTKACEHMNVTGGHVDGLAELSTIRSYVSVNHVPVNIARLRQVATGEILSSSNIGIHVSHGATSIHIRPSGLAVYTDAANRETKMVNQTEAEALVQGGSF